MPLKSSVQFCPRFTCCHCPTGSAHMRHSDKIFTESPLKSNVEVVSKRVDQQSLRTWASTVQCPSCRHGHPQCSVFEDIGIYSTVSLSLRTWASTVQCLGGHGHLQCSISENMGIYSAVPLRTRASTVQCLWGHGDLQCSVFEDMGIYSAVLRTWASTVQSWGHGHLQCSVSEDMGICSAVPLRTRASTVQCLWGHGDLQCSVFEDMGIYSAVLRTWAFTVQCLWGHGHLQCSVFEDMGIYSAVSLRTWTSAVHVCLMGVHAKCVIYNTTVSAHLACWDNEVSQKTFIHCLQSAFVNL